ncbi:MAG TPA: alpha/beta fold hydrolase, partial [Caulobacteraceae bacterium]
TGQTNPVALVGSHAFSWVVAPDGAIVAHSDYNEISGAWQLAPGSGPGGIPLLSAKTPLNDISLLGLGRTPGTVLIEDSTGTEDRFEEVSLATGAVTPLLEGYNVKTLAWDNVTHLFLGAEVRGPEGAVLFDPKLQAKVRGAFKAFAGRHVELVSYNPSFDDLIVMTDGADDSGTYWFVDIAKGSAVRLGGVRPGVPAEAVGPTRMFAYKASDGLALEGVLTLPPGKDPKTLPLVVMPHGGPLGERDDIGFDWWAQAFASRGYAVFQPNYRGSGGYGLAFEKAGYGEWGRKMLSDTSDGVAALAAQGLIDPKKVCVVGGSYGGYAALAGVTLQQGIYRCAVSYAGISDLPALRRFEVLRKGDNNALARSWKTAIQGDAKGEPGLDQISPARLAASANAPILLMHGKDDTVAPIDQSREMASALKAAGKPASLVEFTGQDHWLGDEDSRIQILKASLDFVQTNNPAN